MRSLLAGGFRKPSLQSAARSHCRENYLLEVADAVGKRAQMLGKGAGSFRSSSSCRDVETEYNLEDIGHHQARAAATVRRERQHPDPTELRCWRSSAPFF